MVSEHSGAALIVTLEEYIRVAYGSQFIGVSQIVYGIALVSLIMFLPKGICGSLGDLWRRITSR